MIQTNSISSVDFCPNVNAAGKLKHTTTFVNRGKGWELKCEQGKEIEGMKTILFWARLLYHRYKIKIIKIENLLFIATQTYLVKTFFLFWDISFLLDGHGKWQFSTFLN